MTAFVIRYCIVTHIKITIQSLYCNPLPLLLITIPIPLFFFYYFFIILPYGHIDIAKAEIDIYERYSCILDIYCTDKKFTNKFLLKQVFKQFPNWQTYSCPILLNFAQIRFCKKYVIDKTYTHRLPLILLGFD